MTDWNMVYTLAGILFVIFMVFVVIFTAALERFDDPLKSVSTSKQNILMRDLNGVYP